MSHRKSVNVSRLSESTRRGSQFSQAGVKTGSVDVIASYLKVSVYNCSAYLEQLPPKQTLRQNSGKD